VVDVEEGITPMDDAVARLLRKVTKPVLLAVNKVDNAMREKDAIEFYNLGLENTPLQYFRKWNWRFIGCIN
jgi:GTP-binding protein